MTTPLTRRQVILGGAVLLITGCAGRSPRAASTAGQPAFPPYDLPRSTADTSQGGLWYQVAQGDTLSSIARRSGVDAESIAQANHLSTAQLTRGQSLFLPGAVSLAADPLARLRAPQEEAPVDSASESEAGGYVLVNRTGWAVSAVRSNNLPMGGVSRITIHHTGEHPGMEGVPEVEVLRRIEHYHQVERHWAAIGYHYLVGKTGRVYEGRPVHYQGAHVSGANEHNLGISVIGDFMHQLPNATQLAAVDAFLTDQRIHYKIRKSHVYGHRELGPSQCPGDMLFSWLQHYRA